MKFIILIFFLNMFFVLNFSSPLTLLVSILTQTLAICFLGWLISNSSWFAYILFIIYLGGLMVLFVYIVSLASNEKFFHKINFNYLIFISFIATLSILMTKMNLHDLSSLKNNFSMNFYFMFTNHNKMLLIFSMFYLLFSLIVVIKICNKFKGPLKSY